MKIPTTLYNYFNQGRESLELSTALLNPYAKWMQSPNIPRNTCLPIALTNVDSTKECDTTVDEWFQKFVSNSKKTHVSVPDFFPQKYKSSDYYSVEHKGEDKWIYGLLTAIDSNFLVYSDNCKQQAVTDLVTKATSIFPKVYDVNVFRLYGEKKAEIYASLFRSPSPAGLHIYSCVLNKNIVIVREFGYELCCTFSNERDTLCFWENSGDIGTINNNVCGIEMDSIFSSMMDLFEERTRRMRFVSNKDCFKKSRELSKKSLSDLIKEAHEMDVSVQVDGKNLRKQELIDSLLNQFSEQTTI